MCKFLIIYGILFLICFIWFTTSSMISCERKNKRYIFKQFKVDYFKCFFKALFFPITLFFMFVVFISTFIAHLISNKR